MTEEQFSKFLKTESQDYNRPPPVPRDEMWARIDARRRRSRDSKTGFRIVPRRRSWVVGVGIAAALVLGVAIGMRVNTMFLSPDAVPVAATPENGVDATVPGGVVQLVALEHLGRTAGFLTMFRADARAGRQETDVAEAARDMLATTRLLQGSSAALDPRVKGLLDDLELILVQIAQLRDNGDSEERAFITQGIEQRDILLKLRSATSDRPALPSIQGVL